MHIEVNSNPKFTDSLMEKPCYHNEIIVESEHIDALGHVNNVVYLEWVLMMAGKHWFALATAKDRERYRWVVRRHEIDYLKPAFLGEKLMATTWVEDMGGVQSLRKVQLKRGDEVIMNALTQWVFIQAETGKFTRIPESLTRLYIP